MIKFLSLAISILTSISAHAFSITILNSSGMPAKGIVVYLSPVDKSTKQATASIKSAQQPSKIYQQDKAFSPYLSVVQSNSEVIFENNDDITHHIYSLNSAQTFDFKLSKDNDHKPIYVDTPNEIAMGCNIHDWMAGHLLVIDTPFYQVTDQKGEVTWSNIPQGNYQISVFHPQMSQQDKASKHPLSIPTNEITLTLSKALNTLPTQQSLEEFDFIESYE